MNERPLAGITILDLGDDATVFGARLLAELGAEVFRVESEGGDTVRARGPFLHGKVGPERSLAHLLFNAGKRSVAVNEASAEARSAVRRLALACDAVIAPLYQTGAHRELFAALEAAPDGPGVVDAVFRRDRTSVV